MSVFADKVTFCGDSACPLEAFHGAGPYCMDRTDKSQAHLRNPPREVVEAMASLAEHPSEDDIHHNYWHATLLERFEEIYNGWSIASATKKQPSAGRKGKGKKVYNWQAARQNGPKPLIIGKGKKVVVKDKKPIAATGERVEKTSTTLASTPAASVAEDALTPEGKKLDWAADV
ncbi:MAG: hypothetical protein Q9207_007922 [Kuettlingeria erythrocarpa]